MAGSSAGSIRVDADEYARVRLRAKEFDPLLDRELQKALRKVAKIGADAAKAKIRTMPSHGGHRPGHGSPRRPQFLRSKIAANIRVQATGKDVKIVQGVTGISGRNARGLVRNIDQGGTFRHRVFGHDVWVSQAGYAYFKRPIEDKRPEMEREVGDALDRAVRVIAGRL